jgi:hypothetical protein
MDQNLIWPNRLNSAAPMITLTMKGTYLEKDCEKANSQES